MGDEMDWERLGAEFTFIGRVAHKAEAIPGSAEVQIVQGIGDDTAVLKFGECTLLWTTDMMVEGVHFRRDIADPFRLGWKALAVNLSDIAAMGGIPAGALFSCALPPELLDVWGKELIEGFTQCAKEFQCPVLGGDTNRSDSVVLDVSVLGIVENAPLLRSTAQPGDRLFVTGKLGNSRAGLERLLMSGLEKAEADDPKAVQSHLQPTPRLMAGQSAARHRASAMMDLSDGLGADLPKLCLASGCGAVLEERLIPVGKAVRRWAKQTRQKEVPFAIAGGEDYELLIAVPPDKVDAFRTAVESESGVSLSEIGFLTSDESVVLENERGHRAPLPAGWEHFSTSDNSDMSMSRNPKTTLCSGYS
jgi:thiamine-monophosphate kinase